MCVASISCAFVQTHYAYTTRYVFQISKMLHPLPFILIVFLAPLAVMFQFGFLNCRDSSDFFHSLPYKKLTLCLSYFASALSWMFLISISSVIIIAVVLSFNPFIIFSFDAVLVYLLLLIVFAFVLMSIMLIAMTITGTAAKSLLVYFCCIALPGIFLILFETAIVNYLPIVHYKTVLDSLPAAILLLPLELFQFLIGQEILKLNLQINLITIAIMFILFAILTVLGCLLFIKKKAEDAGKATASPLVNAIFHCIICLPTAIISALFAMGILATKLTYYTSTSIFLMTAFLTLLIFYAYGLFTTKKPSDLLKSSSSLVIVIAFTLLFCGGFKLAKEHIYSFSPQADEVESIQLISNPDDSFHQMLYSDLEYTEDDIKAKACDLLRATKDYYILYPKLSLAGSYVTSKSYIETATLKFNMSDGTTIYRQIHTFVTEYPQLCQSIKSSHTYIENTAS